MMLMTLLPPSANMNGRKNNPLLFFTLFSCCARTINVPFSFFRAIGSRPCTAAKHENTVVRSKKSTKNLHWMFCFSLQVLVTNLELEAVGHLEPANFWIGPSAVRMRKLTQCIKKYCSLDIHCRVLQINYWIIHRTGMAWCLLKVLQ